jgi:hypothetical protein
MKVYSVDFQTIEEMCGIEVSVESFLSIYLTLDTLYGLYKSFRFAKRRLLNEPERSEPEKFVFGPYSFFCEGIIRLGDGVIDRITKRK